VKDSKVSYGEVLKRAVNNWYINAREAVEPGLVRAVI
jgi:hypothetical protein